MGHYIDKLPNGEGDLGLFTKVEDLVNKAGAKEIDEPLSFNDIPPFIALICVVENEIFDAAAYCYSENEFKVFTLPDPRKKTWLLMAKKIVNELTGYKQ